MRAAGEKKRLKLTRRVQFKLVLAFFALIAALLVLLNTYPVYSARDMVFAEKESSLLEQASVISSSLAAMDSLSGDGAAQVVELLALSGLERILITDASGEVLYDLRVIGQTQRTGTTIRSEAAWAEWDAAQDDGRWHNTINPADLQGYSTDYKTEGTRG